MAETNTPEGRPTVVTFAKSFVDGKQHSYKQFRGKDWETDAYMDCSEFVYQAYKAANMQIPVLNSHGMANQFPHVDTPQPGDIVYWEHGHVGIVEDQTLGFFLHAASTKSGLRRDNYKQGWWAGRSGRKFLRPVVTTK